MLRSARGTGLASLEALDRFGDVRERIGVAPFQFPQKLFGEAAVGVEFVETGERVVRLGGVFTIALEERGGVAFGVELRVELDSAIGLARWRKRARAARDFVGVRVQQVAGGA